MMIERITSELLIPPERRSIQAVSAIIVAPTNRVHTIVETSTRKDYGKVAGMRTIPMETMELGETHLETLARLFKEEAGREHQRFVSVQIVGIYGLGGAAATCFVVRVEEEFTPVTNTGDVKDPKWLYVCDAMNLWTRQGAFEMLSDFTAGRRGVSRNACHPVSLEPIK